VLTRPLFRFFWFIPMMNFPQIYLDPKAPNFAYHRAMASPTSLSPFADRLLFRHSNFRAPSHPSAYPSPNPPLSERDRPNPALWPRRWRRNSSQCPPHVGTSLPRKYFSWARSWRSSGCHGSRLPGLDCMLWDELPTQRSMDFPCVASLVETGQKLLPLRCPRFSLSDLSSQPSPSASRNRSSH